MPEPTTTPFVRSFAERQDAILADANTLPVVRALIEKVYQQPNPTMGDATKLVAQLEFVARMYRQRAKELHAAEVAEYGF